MSASGWLGLNWGDVPAWVGSVLTGVALLVAANTYRKSVRDSEREQAKTVTVWVEEERSTGFLRRENTLHIMNGSSATIYSATAYYKRQGKFAPTWSSPYYEVRDSDSGLIGLGRWASIGPGEERQTTFRRSKASNPEIPWLYFRDSNGVDWIRDYRARLKRHNYWLMRNISEGSYLNLSAPRRWLKMALVLYGFSVYGVRGWAYDRARRAKARDDAGRTSGWQPWYPILAGVKKMQPGAAVTALWRPDGACLDLFATDTDGTVWSTSWQAESRWQPWYAIQTGVKMQPGAAVTALWRPDGACLDLFATDTDGTVWSTWWEAESGWRPWFAIQTGVKMQPGPAGAAPWRYNGAAVTKLWRPDGARLDLFATDTNGAVCWTWSQV
jgi:hypothetical protein